ncbi:hypothetical protein NEOLEDRAFT_1130325 [Neolentinus lepideus HHB14362 ss-1]|uniref:Uncharacterized protein n=1 Tax=Neolentinus lepideus HHB14362 ss-1 TaxID=1314782 RepID=A0A165U9N1_9AGAM|nr:hypothetical protein NEOLEDRAFT_1130325 [Neolentinus lepideus HHB14362 ss-1]
MSYRNSAELEGKAPSAVDTIGTPSGDNLSWSDEEQSYSLHHMHQVPPQDNFQHTIYQPEVQPFHQNTIPVDGGYPQWPDIQSASWNPQWSQYSQGSEFHYHASSRQDTLTVRTDVVVPPNSVTSPVYGESPSAYLPPSAATLVDGNAPFRSKLQSPISPASPQIYRPIMSPMVVETNAVQTMDPQSTHQEQLRLWKSVQQTTPGIIPQRMYKPQAANDKKRYIDEIRFDAPIIFRMSGASEDGITVHEALHGHLGNLQNKDDEVFINCGPSVSIRLNWPGYDAWSKQIPTKNWKATPGPITRQKLAKQVARRIEEFIKTTSDKDMDEDGQPQWKVGPHGIQLHDLILVSLHHVSKGSWQPQLRLRL